MKRAFLFLAVLLFAITTEVIAANGVLGPHPMTYEAATPSGYGKVEVTSNPEYTGGWIELTSETGGKNMIHGSVTYMSIWFYFVPSGNYTVTDMSDDHTVTINGYGQISIGDVVTFYNGGHIGFKTKN